MSIPDELAAHPDYVAYCKVLIDSRIQLLERVEACDLNSPVAVALMLRFVQKQSDIAPVDFLVAIPNSNYGNLLEWSNGHNQPPLAQLILLKGWLIATLSADISSLTPALPLERKKAL